MWETVVRYYGVDWLAMVLNALTIFLLGKKVRLGWALGIVANAVWVLFGVMAHSLATVVACTIFMLLNAKGWWGWRAEPAVPEKADH